MTRLISALALLVPATHACTAVIAGAKASADGSVLVTHSDDGEGDSDARLGFVPAANHSAGAMRPVWPDLETFPRYVGSARGDTYLRKPGETDTVPIGYIPEVPHTYAYFEANYGIQNEHQLSIGESTCSAVFGSAAIGQVNGTALLNVNELSRIALERTTNARDAIRTMGDLASRYGFYGPGTFEGTGETLLVGDPSEGFVFHILPDDTGRSAVWVAQRVPDDEVTVVANMFTIREVNCDDEQNFLCSPNLHSLAIKHNLWDGQGQLDFVRAYSDGEYAHQYYSGRRMWRALDIFAPSLGLPSTYTDLKNDTNPKAVPGWTATYPWSVKPDTPVSAQSLMALHRDHYEGTKYDTTKGIGAGAFGSPDRYATLGTKPDIETGSRGAWERTIGLYRTTFTWVLQARKALPDAVGGTIWFGVADADKTVFLPLYVAAGAAPPSLMIGKQTALDRGSQYWAHRYVQNIVQLRYEPMMRLDVRPKQAELEQAGAALQYELDTKYGGSAASGGSITAAQRADMQQMMFAHVKKVLDAWWLLADALMVKHADGYLTDQDGIGQPTGYPAGWLNRTGFHDGPHRIDNGHP